MGIRKLRCMIAFRRLKSTDYSKESQTPDQINEFGL